MVRLPEYLKCILVLSFQIGIIYDKYGERTSLTCYHRAMAFLKRLFQFQLHLVLLCNVCQHKARPTTN